MFCFFSDLLLMMIIIEVFLFFCCVMIGDLGVEKNFEIVICLGFFLLFFLVIVFNLVRFIFFFDILDFMVF